MRSFLSLLILWQRRRRHFAERPKKPILEGTEFRLTNEKGLCGSGQENCGFLERDRGKKGISIILFWPPQLVSSYLQNGVNESFMFNVIDRPQNYRENDFAVQSFCTSKVSKFILLRYSFLIKFLGAQREDIFIHFLNSRDYPKAPPS